MKVAPLIRRVVAGLTLAVLAAGDVAVCAGWEATAEARMACCLSGDSCPMHHGPDSGPDALLGISQSEADRCCAASEPKESAPSASAFVAIVSLPVVGNLFVSESLHLSHWIWHVWDDAPPPPGHVSRQALLSVFLI